MEEKEEEGRRVIIGRDFNARTGEMGGEINMEDQGTIRTRNSKNKKATKKKLVEVLQKTGWSI